MSFVGNRTFARLHERTNGFARRTLEAMHRESSTSRANMTITARMARPHKPLILNPLEAREQVSRGAVEQLTDR